MRANQRGSDLRANRWRTACPLARRIPDRPARLAPARAGTRAIAQRSKITFVDALTHGLASLALQRGFFPRASWRTLLAILFTGIVADVDSLSASFGPAAYLRWHRTITHSLVFILMLAFVAFLFSRTRRDGEPSVRWAGFSWIAILAASALHLVMDLLQTSAVVPLWPFSAKRISLDIEPAIDPWLLVILASAILIPELLHLVSDEIGSRTKRPRGRNGAIAGLAFALIYFGLRASLHATAVATLEARTIAGEMPHRVAAFPDSVSPILWHGIIETESALHLVVMRRSGLRHRHHNTAQGRVIASPWCRAGFSRSDPVPEDRAISQSGCPEGNRRLFRGNPRLERSRNRVQEPRDSCRHQSRSLRESRLIRTAVAEQSNASIAERHPLICPLEAVGRARRIQRDNP